MIAPATCLSYVLDLVRGVHRATDTYRIALYTAGTVLNAQTTAYSQDGEVAVSGSYLPGGLRLQGFESAIEKGSVVVRWTVDPVWTSTTIKARGALIYNETRARRAVAVLDFGKDISSTNAPFTVRLPPTVIRLAEGIA